jgi:hypothetical protein
VQGRNRRSRRRRLRDAPPQGISRTSRRADVFIRIFISNLNTTGTVLVFLVALLDNFAGNLHFFLVLVLFLQLAFV